MKSYHNLKLSHHNMTVLMWRMQSERPSGFEKNLYLIKNRSYSMRAIDLWILVQLLTKHSTTSNYMPFRGGITLNTQLEELPEATSSSWSIPIKICSTFTINLYPAQKVLLFIILFFLDVSYILFQVLIFSQPSSLFVYRTYPFLSFFLPHCFFSPFWVFLLSFSWRHTHLASNYYHCSLVDSRSLISSYLVSQILFRTK